MITNKDIQNEVEVVHARTQERYIIVNCEAQLKVEEGKWIPAVIYRRNVSHSSWLHPVFIRDTTTFMANFSLPEEPSNV